ncbi:unnamed protein product [Phaeothamnion confervicola]
MRKQCGATPAVSAVVVFLCLSFRTVSVAFVAGNAACLRHQYKSRMLPPAMATAIPRASPSSSRGRRRRPFAGECVRWLIHRAIATTVLDVSNLDVAVQADGNRAAATGRLEQLSVSLDTVVTDAVTLTGGLQVDVLGLDFTPLPGPLRRRRRLRRAADVRVRCTLEGADVTASPALRRLVQLVLNLAVTKGRSQGPVRVRTVYLRGSKVVCEGDVSGGPLVVPFRYLTRLSASSCGHVLSLRDAEVAQTGPGTLGARLPLPLPMGAVDIDLGDGARIDHVLVARSRLVLDGRFTLSPAAVKLRRGSGGGGGGGGGHRAAGGSGSRGNRGGGRSEEARRAPIHHDLGETLSAIVCTHLGLLR